MSTPAHCQDTPSLPASAHLTKNDSGLAVLEIIAPAASARIFVQGAHIVDWQPAGAKPVLFTSKQSFFKPGKAIRGGVPVCFPWFANRAGHPESPAHGFVRTSDWTLESVTELPDGGVAVQFGFTDSAATLVHWPNAFRATYRLIVGRELGLELNVKNTGDIPLTYEAALHTYFAVSDAASVEITGLEQTEYIDKVDGFTRKVQSLEPIRFTSETDRIYLNTDTTTRLLDPGWNRTIVVEKKGSQTTVVWNPWIAKAKAMSDFGDDEWPQMACIETANAGDSAITLPPGQDHTMTARIRLA